MVEIKLLNGKHLCLPCGGNAYVKEVRKSTEVTKGHLKAYVYKYYPDITKIVYSKATLSYILGLNNDRLLIYVGDEPAVRINAGEEITIDRKGFDFKGYYIKECK